MCHDPEGGGFELGPKSGERSSIKWFLTFQDGELSERQIEEGRH